jgi:tripartite-type tricarboxylate transporter receptor subunit TctC
VIDKMIQLLAVAAALFASSVYAQAWPAKTIRWIIPWPPGGGADVLARVLQPSLSEALGQPVVVDNRGGAAGNIGAELAAKSPPDGYTIVFAYSGTHSINPHIYRKMPFRESDFAPLIWTASVPQVVVVHPSLPVKTPRDIVTLAKSKPDQFTYGSSGNGAINHLAGAFFASLTGSPLTHVPYKGGGPAVISLLSGETALLFATIPSSVQHFKTGKLRALGVSSLKRNVALPDIPTIAEAAVPGFEANEWNGALVPAGTPRAVIDRLYQAVAKSIAIPEVRERIIALGAEPVGNTPEEFGAFIRREFSVWAKIIREVGIKVE